MGENIPLLVTEDILLSIDLDAAALVLQVNEHALSHVAMRRDTPGDGNFATLDVIAPRHMAGFSGRKFIFERVNAFGAQSREFGLALFDQ